MKDLIQDELTGLVRDWRAGRRITSVALGHSTQEIRQKHAHALAFELIERILDVREDPRLLDLSTNIDRFSELATEVARLRGSNQDEKEAAISLAWVALQRGWQKMLSEFPESQHITLAQDAVA